MKRKKLSCILGWHQWRVVQMQLEEPAVKGLTVPRLVLGVECINCKKAVPGKKPR